MEPQAGSYKPRPRPADVSDAQDTPCGETEVGVPLSAPPPRGWFLMCVDRVTLCYAADLFSSTAELRTAQISSSLLCAQGPGPASWRRCLHTPMSTGSNEINKRMS